MDESLLSVRASDHPLSQVTQLSGRGCPRLHRRPAGARGHGNERESDDRDAGDGDQSAGQPPIFAGQRAPPPRILLRPPGDDGPYGCLGTRQTDSQSSPVRASTHPAVNRRRDLLPQRPRSSCGTARYPRGDSRAASENCVCKAATVQQSRRFTRCAIDTRRLP